MGRAIRLAKSSDLAKLRQNIKMPVWSNAYIVQRIKGLERTAEYQRKWLASITAKVQFLERKEKE